MKLKRTPKQVAGHYEFSAQLSSDIGYREGAEGDMEVVHAIRYLCRALERLSERAYSGYDFEADPDGIKSEVSDLLKEVR